SREFDYGEGPRPSVAVGWGDIASAYYTTGVPNIEVYFEATVPVQMMMTTNRYWGTLLKAPAIRPLLEFNIETLPDGPTDAERARGRGVIVAEAEDAVGHRARARLHTPEAYTFTCMTALGIVDRVLRGDVEIGFQTPARV